ncbi:MAG: type II toxin-antitoxin system HicB family antitoxin [Clostridium sp.]|nr:type II toxin-antitoxin system HicB family antitoxin [Clostridium sp.]
MKTELFYPAVFQTEDDGGFSVFFPDIDGCNTCGDNLNDAYEMASDALGLVLSYMDENNEIIPEPSTPNNLVLDEGQFVVLIKFNMLEYLKKNNSKSIKKTLTIPEWLNEEALRCNINFSQALQEVLMEKIQAVK